MPKIDTILRRYQVQVKEVHNLRQKSIIGGGPNAVYTDYVTCQGTQPSRVSGKGHRKCDRQVSMMYAYKCLYCNFWFCAKCAEIHFGKTREQHNKEMTEESNEATFVD